MSVNKVILVEKVGKDVKTEYSKSGVAIANLSIATSEKLKDGYRTTWHDVVCFSGIAEYCHKRVHSGDTVFVEGKIDKNAWEDKEGIKRTSMKIICNLLNHFPKEARESTNNGYKDPE